MVYYIFRGVTGKKCTFSAVLEENIHILSNCFQKRFLQIVPYCVEAKRHIQQYFSQVTPRQMDRHTVRERERDRET